MKQTTNLVVVGLLIVAAASVALNFYQYSSPRKVTETTEVGTTSTSCIILGQPGGIMFRVLSDATSEPVSGVAVIAVNTPATCNGSPATNQTVDMFTTNETEWRSLPSDNNYQYSFVVNYQGRTFTLTATLRPVSLTCATLYVPSGKPNITITEFGNGC